MGFNFSVIARNPPMAFIVAGVFLVALGGTNGDPSLMNIGNWCFIGGFVLQLFWLMGRRGRL